MNSIYIFRRDLRLFDNTGLIKAMNQSERVLCCFIFDPKQLEGEYFSSNAFEFMINSLRELKKDIEDRGGKLYLFKGKSKEIVRKLVEKGFRSVYVNKDYTPFSYQRDSGLKLVCTQNNAKFFAFDDYLLNKPGSVLKDDGTPYTVFTPFYKKALNNEIKIPLDNEYSNFYTNSIDFSDDDLLDKVLSFKNPNLFLNGGRREGLLLLDKAKKLVDYKDVRDYPALKKTTSLSAHHKFGTLSVRESYYMLKDTSQTLLSELYWRDFFTHIAHFFPEVFGRSFKEEYDALDWSYDRDDFKLWCEGKTGYPLIDAGMRELNSTGFMHNRVRMVVASFLTKNLFIDWRMGEKYFASKLIDYDPCVNNGNWQWASSTGCDAQPYFRIFNPWTQQQKFDSNCEYIKQWVLELKDVDNKIIHEIYDHDVKNYPKPMIDYKESRERALNNFKVLKNNI
jgi:deoxyribodipyrimidine photo-lyase